jgi:hypothetical protein
VNGKFGNVPVLRLSNGYINPQGRPDPLTVMYFVEEKTGYIRGRSRHSIITVFNDLQPFGEKSVARKLTMLGGDVTRMDITVDTLEPATDANESIFRVAGAKPVFTSADEDGRFAPPRAVYTVKPSFRDGMGRSHATSISTNTDTCAAWRSRIRWTMPSSSRFARLL